LTSEVKERYEVIWEEVTFDEKPAIKASLFSKERTTTPPLWYYAYYYNKDTLLKLADVEVCNSDNPQNDCRTSQKGEVIQRYNTLVNQGITESEFEITIPEGAKVCRRDLKTMLDSQEEIESLYQLARDEERVLTEAEFNQIQNLSKISYASQCGAPNLSDEMTYQQYLGELWPECRGILNDFECKKLLLENGKISLTEVTPKGICDNLTAVECLEETEPTGKVGGYSLGTINSQDTYYMYPQEYIQKFGILHCSDTDGGNNINEKGSILLSIYIGDKFYATSKTISDKCMVENQPIDESRGINYNLLEYSCTTDSIQCPPNIYPCDSGPYEEVSSKCFNGCIDGACIQ
jgi:hypothetical protein